ncbi:MAG: type II toxin-antitoxin system RelE/ParE family toxin [Kiritimatiellae bacterium]|jgi:mRNA interferase RelE/StbE|nr:type II toxin-antitoxin system RelE/ParE family toxin [Kiritimatiellia bacterium]
MASYKIEFAKGVRKDFKGVPKKDAERILKKIGSLADEPRPPDCKKLTNDASYRVRIGNYRVVYDIKDEVLLVLIVKVGHRKEIYRK